MIGAGVLCSSNGSALGLTYLGSTRLQPAESLGWHASHALRESLERELLWANDSGVFETKTR